MKFLLINAIALCCLATVGASAESSVEVSISAQENAWAAALIAGDLDTVDSLMHRDFRLVRTYSDALPISKEAYLGMQGMSASRVEVTSVTITEEAGPIVIARVTMSMDWQQEGIGKLPPHFDLLDTWIRGEDDVWRVLARVSQIADAPHKAKSGE